MDAQLATWAPLGPSPWSAIVRQHIENASQTCVWAELAASNHEILEILEISNIHIIMANSCAGIAPHQMKLQTCRSQKIKPHDHNSYLSSRKLIPTTGFRADINQRWSART